jgi:hypothetical protein
MIICCTVSKCKSNDYGHFLGLVVRPLNIVNCTVHRGAEVGGGRGKRARREGECLFAKHRAALLGPSRYFKA